MITALPPDRLKPVKVNWNEVPAPDDRVAFEWRFYEDEDADEGTIHTTTVAGVVSEDDEHYDVSGGWEAFTFPARGNFLTSQQSAVPDQISLDITGNRIYRVLVPQVGQRLTSRPFPWPLWLEEAVKLESLGRRDRAIDTIFREVDRMLRRAEFSECDKVLQTLNPDILSPNLLVAFLTITAAAHSQLPTRARLFESVRQRLANDPQRDSILQGLGQPANGPSFY